MKLLYTHENRLIVCNIKNIVEGAGIEVVVKNEFAAGAAGDLSPHLVWLELWVHTDADYHKAVQILDTTFNANTSEQWVCAHCSEKNYPSFEICWNCQTPHLQ